MQLVISDAHEGLKAAIAGVFVGSAWQRCRVHFMRNVLARVPRGSAEMVAAAVRTIFAQPDAAAVFEQLETIADKLGRQFPAVATMLRDAAPDILAFAAFPQSHWRKIWSTNPLERVNVEIKRGPTSSGSSPTRTPSCASPEPSFWRCTTSGPSPNAATSPPAPWRSSTRPGRMTTRRRWNERTANWWPDHHDR